MKQIIYALNLARNSTCWKEMNEEQGKHLRKEIDKALEEVKKFSSNPLLADSSFCECISRTGIDGTEHGKWTCRSCGKEVAK